MNNNKIINDPVYGFITIHHPLILKLINHQVFQRLRRIHQMALAYLVYPGATHTRLHHSLGAYHLMCNAIENLRQKGIEITIKEEVATQAAILLHDVGHGPFSHALENILLPNVHHEMLSIEIMKMLNKEMNGELNLTIQIYTNQYPKKFLHQLISGQLDVDRMDYLTRDSFFTGVSEGVIGYDRILKMLTVKNDELVVEEKGIYSIEKFLIARRQMYWQVYLHKTVLSAETMLINIVQRAKTLILQGNTSLKNNSALDFFLYEFDGIINEHVLHQFLLLDDVDMNAAIKKWSHSSDKVLSILCNKLLNRDLLKIRFTPQAFSSEYLDEMIQKTMQKMKLSKEGASYFVMNGETENTLYKNTDERINILFKDGTTKDISTIDNTLINPSFSEPVKKFYLCFLE